MTARKYLSPWRYLMRYKFTDSGKLVFAAMLLTIMLGSLSLGIPVYHIFTALLSLMILTALCSLFFRPSIAVSGQFPPKAVAGRQVQGRFTLTNNSRRAAYDASLSYFNLPRNIARASHESVVPHLASGESSPFDISLLPARRGLYMLRALKSYSTFPFNLFRSGRKAADDESLLVLPSFHRLTNIDVPASPRYQPGGIALTSNIGESPEYIGNRDYRPGDPLRRIDGRAWARLATPIVKEFQEEYYCRIAIVLDTHIPWKRRWTNTGFADFEAAVSMTAAAAEAMSRGEYIIDLFAAGPDLYVFRSGRHTAHLQSVMEILACVDKCANNPFDKVAPALSEELHNISSVVFVLLDWDSQREKVVRSAAEAGCRTKVLVVRDGPTTIDHRSAETWTDSFTVLTARQVKSGEVHEL